MKIGFTELLVILVVALLVLGPDKLPLYMKKLGIALREFRKYSGELTDELKENVITPLDEAQKPLREAMEPLTEMEEEFKTSKKEIEKSFAEIGKVKKMETAEDENVAVPENHATLEAEAETDGSADKKKKDSAEEENKI